MVPVRIAVNLMLVGSMYLCGQLKCSFGWKAALISVSACGVMIMIGAAALWFVKHESFIRAIIVSWNTDFYGCVSILAATVVSLLLTGERLRAVKEK
jgi:hypothetical protein